MNAYNAFIPKGKYPLARHLAVQLSRPPLPNPSCMNSYYSPKQFLLGLFGHHFATREVELVAREENVSAREKQVAQSESTFKQREKAVEDREEEVSVWSDQVEQLERAVDLRKQKRELIQCQFLFF